MKSDVAPRSILFRKQPVTLLKFTMIQNVFHVSEKAQISARTSDVVFASDVDISVYMPVTKPCNLSALDLCVMLVFKLRHNLAKTGMSFIYYHYSDSYRIHTYAIVTSLMTNCESRKVHFM